MPRTASGPSPLTANSISTMSAGFGMHRCRHTAENGGEVPPIAPFAYACPAPRVEGQRADDANTAPVNGRRQERITPTPCLVDVRALCAFNIFRPHAARPEQQARHTHFSSVARGRQRPPHGGGKQRPGTRADQQRDHAGKVAALQKALEDVKASSDRHRWLGEDPETAKHAGLVASIDLTLKQEKYEADEIEGWIKIL